MVIHIGDSVSINEKDIVAILDRKTIDASFKKNNYLGFSIENLDLIKQADESVKSYIIVSEKNKILDRSAKKTYKIYVSNISSRSLLKRHKDIDRREIHVE